MKSTSIFINISRGIVVDQDDLYDALANNVILAAGLDVTTPNFLPPDHKLHSLKNCYITPYIAWTEQNTIDRRLSIAIMNIIKFFEGEPLLYEIPKNVI